MILFPSLLAQTDLKPIDCFGAFCDDPAKSGTTVETIITTIVGFLTVVAGLAFLVYFLVGALSWVTAGGDKGKVDSAKMIMTNGAIGMIAVVAAYAVIWIVGSVLGIDILNPAQTLFGTGAPTSNPSSLPNIPNAPALLR